MAKGHFKYDLLQLIQSVGERPCIWDKTSELYKDRIERSSAWEEIYRILDERYDDNMTWEQRKAMGEHVMNKWTNIRDTFIKTLKLKKGKPKRKYVYHDHLQFLLKVTPLEESTYEYLTEEPSTSIKQDDIDIDVNRAKKKKKTDHDEEYVPKKLKKEKQKTETEVQQDSDYETFDGRNDNENIDFADVDSDPRLMNEDEAFFASLLPSVVKYSEEERIEFRMEVLAIMRNIISKRRRWNSNGD